MTIRSPDSEYRPGRWNAARPRRRETAWVLLIGLLCVAAMPVLAMSRPGTSDHLPHDVVPLSMLLIVGTTMSPFAQGTFLSARRLAERSEREREGLLAAMRWAFYANVLLVGGTFAWLDAGAGAGWATPHAPSQWGAVGYALVVVMLAMPVLLAEFLVPMPDAGDRAS